jgi:hypothetical protein
MDLSNVRTKDILVVCDRVQICWRIVLSDNYEGWVVCGGHHHAAVSVYMGLMVVDIVVLSSEHNTRMLIEIVEPCPLCEEMIRLIVIKGVIASPPFHQMPSIIMI